MLQVFYLDVALCFIMVFRYFYKCFRYMLQAFHLALDVYHRRAHERAPPCCHCGELVGEGGGGIMWGSRRMIRLMTGAEGHGWGKEIRREKKKNNIKNLTNRPHLSVVDPTFDFSIPNRKRVWFHHTSTKKKSHSVPRNRDESVHSTTLSQMLPLKMNIEMEYVEFRSFSLRCLICTQQLIRCTLSVSGNSNFAFFFTSNYKASVG
jgi:hypothetical protein